MLKLRRSKLQNKEILQKGSSEEQNQREVRVPPKLIKFKLCILCPASFYFLKKKKKRRKTRKIVTT